MSWKVVYYQTRGGKETVREFIDFQPNKKRAKIVWMIELLKKHGKVLPKTYLKRLVGSKNLWELKSGFYRIFLSFLQEKNILFIHAIIKKTQKTPKKDIKLAIKRLNEYL